MRALTITCDNCGKEYLRGPKGERPTTWWTLEQQSDKQTTGAMDFCALPCLARWVTDARVRDSFPIDFPKVPDGHV